MATHSGILAYKIPWTEEPGGLQSMGSQESDMTEGVSAHTHVTNKVCPELGDPGAFPPHSNSR